MNWQWLLNDILKLFKWYSNERKAVGSGHVRKDRAHRFFVRVVFVLFETRRFCKVERFVFPDLRPYGFFYGYLHDGIFQNQQEIDGYTYVDSNGKTQLIQPNAKPGDIRFKDLDGKNGLNGDDRTMIGKPNPDWTYGFTLSADWKGLDFSAFFQGSIGNDIYKLYRRSNVTFGNYDKSWLNRWHGEGTSNWVPRIIDGDNNNYQVSNFFVEDGSYMRLKVLQIGYSLPGQMLQRVGIKGLRFFVQGENLFTITNYSGYDPEVGTRDGFDGGTYPQARTYTIGANITF